MGTCVGTLIATDCGLDGIFRNALILLYSRAHGNDTDRRRSGMRTPVVPYATAGAGPPTVEGLDGTSYNALILLGSRVRGNHANRRRTGLRTRVVPSLTAGWSSTTEGFGVSVFGHGRWDAELRGYPLGVPGKRGPSGPGESIR